MTAALATTTVLDLFDDVVRSDADREAFVHPQPDGTVRRMTFGEWATAGDAAARWLLDRGVRAGDVVAIALPNGLDHVIAYQGVVRAGAVATGINPRLGRREVDHIRALASPSLVVDEPIPAGDGGDPLARRAGVEPSDPFCIVWTGGTTGLPKGAWFDHRALTAVVDGSWPVGALHDRRLSPLPFAHAGSMTRVADELHHRITTVVVPTPWTAVDALALIEAEAVTVCQGVPTQYRMMLDDPSFDGTDRTTLRIAATGAARMPPDLIREMQQRFGCPVVVRYTSTEASLGTTTALDDDAETIATTVGRPSGGVELRIVDDSGDDVAGGDVGTVALRSAAMMRGYWGAAECTAETIGPDGWLRTGDLGSRDAAGNLRLAGRSTEMYVRGGYNVYPIEIEHRLDEHADIAAAAVVGAPVVDRLGEIGVAFAVAGNGIDVAARPSLSDLRAFVGEELADYKSPDALVWLDQLPLTSVGKVDKLALAASAQDVAARWRRG